MATDEAGRPRKVRITADIREFNRYMRLAQKNPMPIGRGVGAVRALTVGPWIRPDGSVLDMSANLPKQRRQRMTIDRFLALARDAVIVTVGLVWLIAPHVNV